MCTSKLDVRCCQHHLTSPGVCLEETNINPNGCIYHLYTSCTPAVVCLPDSRAKLTLGCEINCGRANIELAFFLL